MFNDRVCCSGGATGSVHQQRLLDILGWSLIEVTWSARKEFLREAEALLLSCLIHSSVTVGTERLRTLKSLRHGWSSP